MFPFSVLDGLSGGSNPVSYTHLDVYKRQEAIPVENVETLLNPVEHKQPAPPEEQPEIPTQTGEINVREEWLEPPERPSRAENGNIQEMLRIMMKKMEAVSYTHLDVYKRQV